MITYMQAYLKELLVDYIAVGFATPGKVGLFTGAPLITPSNVIGDFTEATFPGYAQQNLTWGTPFIEADEVTASVNSAVCNFVGGAIVTPETITGFFLLDKANALIGADFLRDGSGNQINVVMTNNGQVLPLLIKMTQKNRTS